MQFKRYISGLIVSENKTIEGMNRLFVNESRNQSSLNILYDHTEDRWVWAHNLVTLHYSDDQTDYPIVFELWRPADLEKIEQGLRAAGIHLKESKLLLKESEPVKWRQYLLGVWRRNLKKAGVAQLYDSKLRIAERQCQQWVQMYPDLKLPIAFDSRYTQPSFCRFLDEQGLAYVGALAGDEEMHLQTGKEKVGDFAQQLKAEHQQAVKTGQPAVFLPTTIEFKGTTETYYTYCSTHRLHNFGKVCLVISHRRADPSAGSLNDISPWWPLSTAYCVRLKRIFLWNFIRLILNPL